MIIKNDFLCLCVYTLLDLMQMRVCMLQRERFTHKNDYCTPKKKGGFPTTFFFIHANKNKWLSLFKMLKSFENLNEISFPTHDIITIACETLPFSLSWFIYTIFFMESRF